ncbi:MAG: hypothetical protein WDM76_07305 [Limisphaerales bacterium]
MSAMAAERRSDHEGYQGGDETIRFHNHSGNTGTSALKSDAEISFLSLCIIRPLYKDSFWRI